MGPAAPFFIQQENPMKVLILNPIAGNSYSYARGEKPELSDADANRLINGGHAIRLIDTGLFLDAVSDAAVAAGYTLMPSPSGEIPDPSGGFYWDDADRLHLLHPAGGRAVIDPLHLLPGWPA